jgi:hypothetical protein
MRALSVRQPWATLLVKGTKDVENRSWRVSYRGPLLICAGLRVEPGPEYDFLVAAGVEMPIGMAVGVVELYDIVTDSHSAWAIPGRYHWLVANARKIKPFPVSGKQGIFTVRAPASLGLRAHFGVEGSGGRRRSSAR